MTDGEIREVVNELRAIAKNFSHTQQLREMISSYIVPILQAARATAPSEVPPPKCRTCGHKWHYGPCVNLHPDKEPKS